MPRGRLLSHLADNVRRYADRPAVRMYAGGTWSDTSWSRFAAMTAAAARRTERAEGPVLVAMDNTTCSLAALLGLACAGVDVAVVEADSTHLADPGSVFHTTGARTVVVPNASVHVPDYRVALASDLTEPDGAVLERADGDVEVLQATSGSTGEPRLARQTLGNLLRGADLYRAAYSVTAADEIVVTVPAAHSFGMVAGLYTAVVTGATLRTFPRFSPRGVRLALAGGAGVLLGTPLVYDLLNRTGAPEGTGVRVALSSGGPLDPEAAGLARQRLGAPVLQAYGSTETGLIACQAPGTWPEGCVGTVAQGVSLDIGADGDLAVRTGTMFLGYHDGTPAALDDRGYYRTGDVARLDRDGTLHLLRRKDTFINVGGRKVNPVRVRRLIDDYPYLVDAAVYGVAALGGEEIRAAVVLAEGGDVPSLLAHCRSRLAGYEIPHQVHVLDTLPRNGMGKIDRSRLPR